MKTSIALTPAPTMFAPLLYAGDLMKGMRRASELGYDGVELNIRDPQAEDLDAIIAAARSYDLEIVSLGTGQAYLQDGISLATADPGIQARCVERLERHVDFAARVGAQVVIGGIRGRFDVDQAVRQVQYRRAVQIVRDVADYAYPRGVTLTIEPINRYESNFINNVEEAIAFLQDVTRPEVKILLDTYHMNIEEVSIPAAFERVASLLSHVHLVDSNRYAPGMGHIDFTSVISALHNIHYEGYLSGEFLPLPDNDTAAKVNIEFVRQLIQPNSVGVE